jgi:hypothetical protein
VKTITVPTDAADDNSLLAHARDEDILVRTADGREFIVSAIDDFDEEIAHTRQNAKLMAFLDERARQTQAVGLAEVKRQLGLR